MSEQISTTTQPASQNSTPPASQAPTAESPYLGPQGKETVLIRKATKNPSFDELLAANEGNESEELPGQTEAKTDSSATPETKVAPPKKEEAEQATEPGSDEAPKEKPTETASETYKFKVGEQEIDVPLEAEILQEVNGKPVKFKIKDAVTAITNQETFNRKAESRIGKIRTMEQKFQAQRDGFEQRLGSLVDRAKNHDLFGLIHSAAEMSGKNPMEVEQEMLTTYNRVMDQFKGLTEQEKKVLFAERKAEYLQSQILASKQEQEWNQKLTQVKQNVNALCEQNSITEDDFATLYQNMNEMFVGPGKKFNDPRQITPQDVISFHHELNMIGNIEEAVKQVAPEKLNQDLVMKVFSVLKDDPSLSVEDIADVLKSGPLKLTSRAENLEQRVQETEKLGFGAQSLKKPIQANSQTRKDIDDEMYDFFLGKRR